MLIFILFLIVLATLYFLTKGTFGDSLVDSSRRLFNWFFGTLDDIKDEVKPMPTPVLNEEVFHVPIQMFSYEEAKEFCRSIGARMATLNEVKKAYLEGAQWVTMGWTDRQLGLYVLQPEYVRRYPNAGSIGINGGYFEDPHIRMGINCYGVKPQPDKSRLEVSYSDLRGENVEVDEEGNVVSKSAPKSKDYRSMLDKGEIVIMPWNDTKWSKDSTEESRYHVYDVDFQANPAAISEQKTQGVDTKSGEYDMKSTSGDVSSTAPTTSTASTSGPSTASASQSPTPSSTQMFSGDRLSDRSQSQAMSYLNRSHLQTILDSKTE